MALKKSFITVWYWLKLLVKPVGIAIVASAFTLVSNTLIFRFLPEREAGIYGLINTLLQLLIVVATLGQNQLMLRIHTAKPRLSFNWWHDMKNYTWFCLPPTILGALGSYLFYPFNGLEMGVLVGSIIFFMLIMYLYPILTANRLYTWSNLIIRLPNSLMIIPGVLGITFAGWARLNIVLVAQSLFYAMAFIIGFIVLKKRVPLGTATTSLSQRWYGLVFLASSSSVLVADQLPIMLGGKFIDLRAVAAFVAIDTLLRPIKLFRTIFKDVFVAEIAHQKEDNNRRILWMMWGAMVVLVLMGFTIMPTIVHVVYAGRYDFASDVIPWITLGHGLALVDSLPRSYVLNQAKSNILNQFIGWQVIISIVGILASIMLIKEYALVGMGLAGVFSFIIRNIFSYFYYWRELQQLAETSYAENLETIG